jgi:hypothetical protein
MNTIDQARQTSKNLRQMSKQAVFQLWTSKCLGRIHSAQIKEQRKDWMVYDIVRSQYGAAIADQV